MGDGRSPPPPPTAGDRRHPPPTVGHLSHTLSLSLTRAAGALPWRVLPLLQQPEFATLSSTPVAAQIWVPHHRVSWAGRGDEGRGAGVVGGVSGAIRDRRRPPSTATASSPASELGSPRRREGARRRPSRARQPWSWDPSPEFAQREDVRERWRMDKKTDLSSNNLRGVVSTNFTSLKALEYLDLSYNNLTGPIPEFLASFPSLKVLNLSGNHLNGPIPYSLCQKSASGSLNFRYESSGDLCNKTIASSSKNKTVLTIVSVVVPVMVVAVLLLVVCVGWQKRRKSRDAVPNPTSYKDLWSDNGPRSRTSHGDPLLNSENKNNRRFTYKQLEMFTNKFERFIGKGGFGPVYYGRLEDGTEVAVKMRAESSSHGIDEFLAEVQSLRTVHHRNLVSLVGYCCEDDHLALVYEYMSQGNLWDHLRGKSGFPEMNWGVRLQAVLGAAQGLDYLHQGCSLPIIHRDVKSSNILLDQNLQAKIADFGLCKTYASEMQTHISTNAAGSAGYFDPEYFHTGRLTKSSDVYSFGVVLLEVATGEPPILPGHGHIVQRVKQGIAAGDISSIADARLGGAYDVSSMWKVVDTAMACTADTADRRPTMAAVVAQLKESLALEEARENRGFMEGPVSDTAALVSTFGPSAR